MGDCFITGSYPFVDLSSGGNFNGFISAADRVLGIVSLRKSEEDQPPVPVDEIARMIEDRQAARRRRDFAAADRVRDDLAARGVLLEDGPGGTRWKRK